MSVVRLTALPPGTAFIRAIVAHVQGGDVTLAAAIADSHYKSTPQVKEFFTKGGFERQHDIWFEKAGVPAGTTAASHAIDDMVAYAFGRDAFGLLQSKSLFGRISPFFRRVPFRTLTPREYGAGAGGAWRGEGLPRPVMQTTADQLQQEVHETSTVFVLTREWLRQGAIYEAALLAMVGQALAKFVDRQLLDPSVTASSARPAAITNGAAAVTSTGNTAAQIVADLSSLIAAITSPGDSLRWVMRSTTLAFINAKLAGVGYPTTPGYLVGIPVIAGSTSPQQITLVDADSILVSYDDVIAADINMVTSVEMDSAPQQNGTTGVGAQMVSMFQARAAAVKTTHNVTWQPAFVNDGSPAQASGVAYMTVAY